MTVWVVGGTGTLGTAVRARLDAHGVSYRSTNSSDVDITQAEKVSAFAEGCEPRHIINCAAYTDVDGAERERSQAAALNERGVANLASTAYSYGATLAHVSTDYVFDGKARTPYRETAACRPLNAYGATKRAGERALEAAIGGFDRFAAAAYVVRTSWLFGPTGRDFVGRIFRLLRDRDHLDVVEDQQGRPTYAPDLAKALLRLIGLTGPAAPSGIYHFANAGEATWFELARTVAVLAGVRCELSPISTASLGRAARRPAYSVLSTDKLTQATGIRPRPWPEALGECLEQFLGIL